MIWQLRGARRGSAQIGAAACEDNHNQPLAVLVRDLCVPQTWDFLRACAERIEVALRERLGLGPIACSPATVPLLRVV